MSIANNHGFTLVEMLLSLAILAIAATASAGLSNQIAGYYRIERDLENDSELRAIADAHIKFAAIHNNGQLLSSYTEDDCYSCAIDTSNVELVNYVESHTQRTASASNYDSSSIKNVRGLMLDATTYQATLNLPSAINLVLEFRAGVVVQTNCPQGSTCNTGESWKTPAYTQTGWAPNSVIDKAIPFNNLEVLQGLASSSVERVTLVQQKIREYKHELVLANNADVDTNFLPVSTHPSTPDYSGSDPTVNGGCINGWYDLSSANVNVLSIVGLEASYGLTLFGGAVEYCADFDLTAVDASTADTAPHVGALRINRFISRGASPDMSNNNNILFPI
ncbi:MULTISPECIES: prepilin-type N-terminal cleavage/methylation domain-containing protein [Pseudoalteromonas]|uniref:prepilin-type N-terminal cleavage/methylation domain-containing protein n=1 Tax=Pseudoalteromonas TaxID=53246 RepID=UPI0015843910|nr:MULTISPECIES: prepilin-type N-terminal cleavage/methylation domain-containing protein [Pseudoalteromonas]MDI4652605.1 prepilin-type N-terminal cleavage/methylation domain-containing protein [Pseudoalteromonas shioyasakiensis]NUJ38686.1 prepilin-type N-terminal cleavage/methylation domain-containing protein [Pseudoalteromonas sp. 0303]